MLISMEKDKRYYRKLAALEGQNSFRRFLSAASVRRLNRRCGKMTFHPSHHLLSVGTLVSEYFARIFWFVTEKWLNYAEEVSALEVMEVYEILFSDSAEKLLGHKVAGETQTNRRTRFRNLTKEGVCQKKQTTEKD